jgi:molybdate transport system substrate-binding protein
MNSITDSCDQVSYSRIRLLAGRAVSFLLLSFPIRAYTQEITISAAASLKPALEEIGKLEGCPKMVLNFGGSGTLQLQIENGAPVDIFISASSRQMDVLEQEGLIVPETRKDLVRNELVLIVPKGHPLPGSFDDLTRPEVKTVAVGEPKAVPAGTYAQEMLSKLKLLDALKSKFVFALDVRQVLTTVASGNADAGLVYFSDAQSSPNVQVIARAPEGSHSPITYSIAALKSSAHREESARLIQFLLAPAAAQVFHRDGFLATP